MVTTNTRSTFDQQLDEINHTVVRMSSRVDDAIERASHAFRNHDTGLAQQIIQDDAIINKARYKVEQDVNTLMALQAPLAHDLRKLLANFIIANELERMGDYAEGIARTVMRYPREAIGAIPPQILGMTDSVRKMLREAMNAYILEDVTKAETTARMDDLVDSLYRTMFKEIVEQMGRSEIPVERGTYLMWTGHNLERMGDRITNICERVIFTKTGISDREMNTHPDHKEPPI